MMSELARVSLSDLASRIASQNSGPSLTGLVLEEGADALGVANEFALELAAQDVQAVVVKTSDLVEDVKRAGEKPVIAFLTEVEGAVLDQSRSRLSHSRPIVLIMHRDVSNEVALRAPHIRSWMGGKLFELEPARFPREERLAELRAAFKMSDEDVLRAATQGSLGEDPHFAEWLVLLGRGDLISKGTPT